MPTGYTSKIEDGQSFEDFVLGCARAFGACLDQRDDPMFDKPKLREESDYHRERLLEDSAELGAFHTMNHEQKLANGNELREEAIARAQKYLNDKIVLKSKYESMRDKVRGWNPPTPDHMNLKTFMIEQINSSIDFDCNVKYALDELEKRTKMTAMEYYDEAVSKLEWSVKYHEEEIAKERKRVEESNNWILELYKSLGITLT